MDHEIVEKIIVALVPMASAALTAVITAWVEGRKGKTSERRMMIDERTLDFYLGIEIMLSSRVYSLEKVRRLSECAAEPQNRKFMYRDIQNIIEDMLAVLSVEAQSDREEEEKQVVLQREYVKLFELVCGTVNLLRSRLGYPSNSKVLHLKRALGKPMFYFLVFNASLISVYLLALYVVFYNWMGSSVADVVSIIVGAVILLACLIRIKYVERSSRRLEYWVRKARRDQEKKNEQKKPDEK